MLESKFRILEELRGQLLGEFMQIHEKDAFLDIRRRRRETN